MRKREHREYGESPLRKEQDVCSAAHSKEGKAGKWRLIVNLSAPEGQSVNEGIDQELCRLKYMSVDDVVQRVLQLGEGADITKADVRGAYRNVPVHPRDWWLLGMEWNGAVFVDRTLPFGLRSAPLLFTALGDAIEWIAKSRGAASLLRHYIYDFVTVGAAGTGECAHTMLKFKEMSSMLGMPLDEKEEGPAEVLTFLGMELDSRKGEVRLPEGRLKHLRRKLQEWKPCRKRDLLSVIRHLSHACKADRAGRSFLRRLLDLSMRVKLLDRRVRLNVSARADLKWWWQFGLQWN